jgi:hypothetical protein
MGENNILNLGCTMHDKEALQTRGHGVVQVHDKYEIHNEESSSRNWKSPSRKG